MIEIGDLVRRVSRKGNVHHGLVIAVSDDGWCEVDWLGDVDYTPTMNPTSNLEVVARAGR